MESINFAVESDTVRFHKHEPKHSKCVFPLTTWVWLWSKCIINVPHCSGGKVEKRAMFPDVNWKLDEVLGLILCFLYVVFIVPMKRREEKKLLVPIKIKKKRRMKAAHVNVAFVCFFVLCCSWWLVVFICFIFHRKQTWSINHFCFFSVNRMQCWN